MKLYTYNNTRLTLWVALALLSFLLLSLVFAPYTAGAASMVNNASPKKPTQLTATVDGMHVNLSWHDNSSNETSFWVMRSRTGNGTDWSAVKKISANGTFTIDHVQDEGMYYYRVRANAPKNGTHSWSNIVHAHVKGDTTDDGGDDDGDGDHRFQVDLFYGNLITSFASGDRYNYRLLDARFVEDDQLADRDFIPSRSYNPATQCPAKRDLTGTIQSVGRATITNHSNRCRYEVGFAGYRFTNSTIESQQLVDSHTTHIMPGQTVNLSIEI